MKEITIDNIFNFLIFLKKTKIQIERFVIGYEEFLVISFSDKLIFNQKIIERLLIQNQLEIYWFLSFEELYQWSELVIDDSFKTHIIFIG